MCATWSKMLTIKKHASTLDMCRTVGGYAKVTLIDGGGTTLKRLVPYNPDQIPQVKPAEKGSPPKKAVMTPLMMATPRENTSNYMIRRGWRQKIKSMLVRELPRNRKVNRTRF